MHVLANPDYLPNFQTKIYFTHKVRKNTEAMNLSLMLSYHYRPQQQRYRGDHAFTSHFNQMGLLGECTVARITR